jgi:hypothetical protein
MVLQANLTNGMTLRQLVRLSAFSEEVAAAVVEAEGVLQETGRLWRQRRPLPQPGNAATRGNGVVVSSDECSSQPSISSAAAASALGLTPRRVCQLADAGDLRAEKTVWGWRIDPGSVEALRVRRRDAA